MVTATATKNFNVNANHIPSEPKQLLMDLHIKFTGLAAWVYNYQVYQGKEDLITFGAPATFTVELADTDTIYTVAYGWVWENDALRRKGVVIGINEEPLNFLKGIKRPISILRQLNEHLESLLPHLPEEGQFLEDEKLARLEGACEALAVLIINAQRARGEEPVVEFQEPGLFLAYLPSGNISFRLGWEFDEHDYLKKEAVLLGDNFDNQWDLTPEEKLEKLNQLHADLADLVQKMGLGVSIEA